MELSKAKVAQPPKLAPVQNAKSEKASVQRRIFVAARTGRGKSTQAVTLPGRKFAYIFDQNALPVLAGADIDYLTFFPESGELETKLKGFNQGSLSDRTGKSQPTLYNRWGDDFDERYDSGFFESYDWIIFDSATTLVDAMFEREMYLNKRTADSPDKGDYKTVGATLSRWTARLAKLPCNVYMTGHISDYKDEVTHLIETQLYLPGSARDRVPMAFTECWYIEQIADKREYRLQTIPGDRGLKDIRSALSIENGADITIKDFSKPENYGIGALLTKAGFKPKQPAKET